MNKRGQFYLTAAILIVLALSGVASISTYAVVKSQPRTVKDLSLNLREESVRVVDYGIYNQEEMQTLIESFAKNDFGPYFLKKISNANIFLIYGNGTDNLKLLQYNTISTGKISIGGFNWEQVGKIAEVKSIESEDGKIKITILEKDYEFELRNNEMFYFIILQNIGEESFVETNK